MGAMKQAGFTLLEIMVALAIVATAMVVLAGRLGASADLQRDVHLRLQALAIGTDLLERARLFGSVPDDGHGSMSVDGDRFEWDMTMRPGPTAGLQLLSVTVRTPSTPVVALSRWVMQ